MYIYYTYSLIWCKIPLLWRYSSDAVCLMICIWTDYFHLHRNKATCIYIKYTIYYLIV